MQFEKRIIFNTDYEYNHTIYLNYPNGFLSNPQNNRLGDNITTFFKSGYRIFVGFIKIYSYMLGRLILGVEGHLNSFIIDKNKNLIIHFEPKGKKYFQNLDTKIIIEYLQNSINDTNTKKTLETFTFLTTITSNFNAPQKYLWDIFCQSYALYSVLLYCLNPDFEDILRLFSQITTQKTQIFLSYYNFEIKDKYVKDVNDVFKTPLIGGYNNIIKKKLRKTKKNRSNKKKTNKNCKKYKICKL